LDERQAWVIQLSYIKKIPQDQAAAEMQVSIRTVQSLKGRAIAALAEMYQMAEKFH
jgi:DNA-directed RNA polymerase specialized sigma24 family protein